MCGSFARERLDFCAGPNITYTKWLAKYVLALREQMSIHAVTQFTGLHWDTVKDIEKRYLARKYAKVSLRGVRRLGIDEVYLGRKLGFIEVYNDPIAYRAASRELGSRTGHGSRGSSCTPRTGKARSC